MTETAETGLAASLPPRWRVGIAWGMWAVAIVSAGAGIVLAALNGWPPLDLGLWGVRTFAAIVTGSLGVLVVSHRPINLIGWLMLWMAVFDGLAAFGLQYGLYGEVVRPGSLPAAELIGTIPYGLAVGAVFGLTISFFLLLFPNGRLPSPRWRPVGWTAGLGVALMVAGLTWHVAALEVSELMDQLGAVGLVMEGTPELFNEVGHLLVFMVFPLAVASLFVRRRQAGPVERQQLKLFAYGAVVFLSSVFIPLPDPYWLWYEMSATTFLFVAVAIAILRYRLYEIDRLVSRTVGYAVVTASLVGVYLLLVFVLGSVLPLQADVAVAASTLAVAALFNPFRRRIQAIVDKRFNRSRYDADQTVEAFSQRLRSELSVVDLRNHLASVAGSSVEPAHVSVWIAGGVGR